MAVPRLFSASVAGSAWSSAMNLCSLPHLLCASLLLHLSGSLAAKETWRILVLGGDGMLGAETVSLMRIYPFYDITVLNRGNWYWDSGDRVKPHVKFIQCDRAKFHLCAARLETDIRDNGGFYAVIDFSSYHARDIKEFLKVTRGKVEKYIYVSTDSVYEVCKEPSHGEASKEEDSERPKDPNTREAYARKDLYGHEKLAGEEVLREEHEQWGLQYIIVRLPDVIGPRDNTNRFWMYFVWVQFHDVIGRPVDLPPLVQNKLLSFVLSTDVAKLLSTMPFSSADAYNRIYNVAFKETVKLEDFLLLIAKHLGITKVSFDKTNRRGSYYFPSVSRGPIDVSRAEKVLEWRPSTLDEGVKATVQFYHFAMRSEEFQDERNAIIRSFAIPSEHMDAFRKKFKAIYGKEFKEKARKRGEEL